MSKLLEILGRAITFDTTDLIWHWLDAVRFSKTNTKSAQVQQLDKIIELVSCRKLETAEEQLGLYLFENPSCPRGRLAAAAICIQKNQIERAIEESNSVYMRQPSNTMALYTLGYCHERLGNESQAVEFYQDCLKFKNYLELPRQRLAAIYFKNSQLERTIEEYELLQKEYPNDISTGVMLGYLYIANMKYSKAIETFNTAILIHPDNLYAEDDVIDQLVRNGQLEEALEHLENLSQQQPESVDLLAKRADILSMLGTTAEAVSQYEQVLGLCPDFLEVTIKLGTQYLQMHSEYLAAQQFNRAVEINDQIVDSYLGLAIAQKLAGNASNALSTLSLAAAIQPNSSLLFAQTAALQFKISSAESRAYDNGAAGTDLTEAVIGAHRQQIAVRPQNPDLHYRLGMLMMNVSRVTEAVKLFQTALDINPTYGRARSKLAVCLFETGHGETALDQLVDSESLDKDMLELHYRVALLYCDKVKFASSLINLEQYMENNLTNADTTVNISIILQNLGLLDRAAAMWDNLSDTASGATNLR